MEKSWSIEEQKDLFRRLGYNVSKWDPNSKEEQSKLFARLIEAQVRGTDMAGKRLSIGELELLSALTGRG